MAVSVDERLMQIEIDLYKRGLTLSKNKEGKFIVIEVKKSLGMPKFLENYTTERDLRDVIYQWIRDSLPLGIKFMLQPSHVESLVQNLVQLWKTK